jgi:predicted dehydrogenase
MSEQRVGIIMNGITGRMGLNQHLVRSILAIRQQGGIVLANGSHLVPDPILVGRNSAKLEQISREHNVARWTTDLRAALANPDDAIYFDAQITALRAPSVELAIATGKHIYCEKPLADDLATALSLAAHAGAAGIKHGVVQDKLFLPGLRKLKRLIKQQLLRPHPLCPRRVRLLGLRRRSTAAQRPSWNYRKQDGGGIISDMFCHWRYVLDHTFGRVRAVQCLGGTVIPQRWDEQGNPYAATADDTAYGTFELDGGIIAQINSSWSFRIYRDELFSLQVDGTLGSAVAGLRQCRIQSLADTPCPIWNPDIENPFRFRDPWQDVPDNQVFDNGFKFQWELFLRHVAEDAPFPHDFLEGARGVQLAELGLQSWHQRCWIDVPN